MKKLIYINISVFFFLFFNVSFSQQGSKQLSIVKINQFQFLSKDTAQFHLEIHRTSEIWDRWANGTFEICALYNDSLVLRGAISKDKVGIEYISGSTDLSIIAQIGQIPTESYRITPRVFQDRISITVIGPIEYAFCIPVKMDSNITIGTFKIFSLDGSALPTQFGFLVPYKYYQACAYKRETDSIDGNGKIVYYANDNIEMEDKDDTLTVYRVFEPYKYNMHLLNFSATYNGDKKISFDWETFSEMNNKGFIIKRAMRRGEKDASKMKYTDLVARYDGPKPGEKALIGMGNAVKGRKYHYEFDSVPFRGEEYCYLLQYSNFTDEIIDLANDCKPVPNAVISYAQGNPNPFTSYSDIDFVLDDNVILTAIIYDSESKEIARLINNEKYLKGRYSVRFNASDIASQGFYQVIFIAYPINDESLELSRALVKLQYVK